MRYVIIGGSIAGISAAAAIRENDPAGEITVISGEKTGPYYRPLIPLVVAVVVVMILADNIPALNDAREKLLHPAEYQARFAYETVLATDLMADGVFFAGSAADPRDGIPSAPVAAKSNRPAAAVRCQDL